MGPVPDLDTRGLVATPDSIWAAPAAARIDPTTNAVTREGSGSPA